MQRISQALALVWLLLAATSPVHAQKGKGGGGGEDGGDPPLPLPTVRYLLTFPDLPPETSGGHSVNDINNAGQVVGWSTTSETISWEAFVYDPAWNEAVLLRNLVDTSNLPNGFILASAIGINDYGVIVGYLQNADGDRLPYAVDLSLENPVVDLLPSAGFNYSMARKINNRGEIVGYYGDGTGATPGTGSTWYLDPGFYGDPQLRDIRDGDQDGIEDALPLNLSAGSPLLLGSILGAADSYSFISNPLFGQPATITGSAGGVLYRIPTVSLVPEFLSADDLDVGSGPAGIDAQNYIVGRGSVPSGRKNRRTYVNFRYGESLQVLPVTRTPEDVSDAGDILLGSNSGGSIYRDWYDGNGPREVEIADLLVGSAADLTLLMAADNFTCLRISNGAIVGGAFYADTSSRRLFVLFEVPN